MEKASLNASYTVELVVNQAIGSAIRKNLQISRVEILIAPSFIRLLTI